MIYSRQKTQISAHQEQSCNTGCAAEDSDVKKDSIRLCTMKSSVLCKIYLEVCQDACWKQDIQLCTQLANILLETLDYEYSHNSGPNDKAMIKDWHWNYHCSMGYGHHSHKCYSRISVIVKQVIWTFLQTSQHWAIHSNRSRELLIYFCKGV